VEKKVVFPAEDLQLEGLLWTPTDGNAERGAVLCHPHPLRGGNMYNNVIYALARALQQHNIATLRFNFRGTGQSTGTHAGGEAEGADVTAAVDYLLQCQNVPSLAVIGYSFGAAVGLLAGATDSRVSTLIGVAPPLERLDASYLLTCTKAKLFVAGDQDHVCPLAAIQDLVARCPEPTALALVAGADHFFVGREDEVTQAVVQFCMAETNA
jgi:alpha/beta superfamily hydrolase